MVCESKSEDSILTISKVKQNKTHQSFSLGIPSRSICTQLLNGSPLITANLACRFRLRRSSRSEALSRAVDSDQSSTRRADSLRRVCLVLSKNRCRQVRKILGRIIKFYRVSVITE